MNAQGEWLAKLPGWILGAVFLLLITGPAWGFELPDFNKYLPSLKYGKLQPSTEVTRMFQTYQIAPQYHYYYSGRTDIPQAMIGINKSHQLRRGLWKPVNLTTQLLRSWIPKMDSIYGHSPSGALILDNTGQRVGIWYSSKQWTTVIIESEHELAIFTPGPPGFRKEH